MTILLIALSVIAVLAILAYMITRRRLVVAPRDTSYKDRPPHRTAARMSPFAPLPPRDTSRQGGAGAGDPSSLFAATLQAEATEPAVHHHHTAATSHETHAAPSHDHGSSYGGHHDGGSSYGGDSYGGHSSGGHDSGGGWSDGGGGGHGH